MMRNAGPTLFAALLAALAALSAAAAPAAAAEPAAPTASGAWVRLNPVPGRPSAGYVGITGGGRPDRLVGASAPGTRIELHSMTMAGGVMRMTPIAALPVPAGGSVALAPGGNHLMIFGLKAGPATLPITLSFGSGARVTVKAMVRAAGDGAPDPHAAPHAAPPADPHAGHHGG